MQSKLLAHLETTFSNIAEVLPTYTNIAIIVIRNSFS